MSPIHVLCTVYNEETFLPYALKSCLPYVQSVTVVEGAYKETIACGASPRSTDKTNQIISDFMLQTDKMVLLSANEPSDADQRNIGLEMIKLRSKNEGWLLILDGDEVYDAATFRMIEALTKKMEYSGAKAAYFKSLTFVNDFSSYTEQEFPRLFKITPDARFWNDNYMRWGSDASFEPPNVIRAPNIKFYHYSFCKGTERFELKKKWWETRFPGRAFNYSWHLDSEGRITDKQHKIRRFLGKHPAVMKDHPWITKLASSESASSALPAK